VFRSTKAYCILSCGTALAGAANKQAVGQVDGVYRLTLKQGVLGSWFFLANQGEDSRGFSAFCAGSLVTVWQVILKQGKQQCSKSQQGKARKLCIACCNLCWDCECC
jgi:hypothetical protein